MMMMIMMDWLSNVDCQILITTQWWLDVDYWSDCRPTRAAEE